MDYSEFLARKTPRVKSTGINVAGGINPKLFDWQAEIVRWALRRGRAALFMDTGTGKTFCQCEWAKHVVAFTGGDVLILAPLAVAQQTVREAAKLGIGVRYCRKQAEVRPGISIANYEMLEHFDPTAFTGVVLDESSVLKNYMGKTKRLLVDSFERTRYKLCCTATPAPNDHMEIGNHTEFLGIMPANEMLTRWFINDTMQMGTYRLKGHAVDAFWDWVASWAVSMRRPSDLGYPDDGFILPPLHLEQVSVPVDWADSAADQLFRTPNLNATTLHQEMRRTAPARAKAVADLVNGSSETWAIYANTNYEADELMARIPGAVEVRGSESIEAKERKIGAFLDGTTRILLSKPSITGYGLNLQFCSHTAFVGLSYSFEQFYQAIRRFYRFGQTRPVNAYLVVAETEGPILAALHEKMAAHEAMMAGMNASKAKLGKDADLTLADYDPRVPMRIPEWLRSVA